MKIGNRNIIIKKDIKKHVPSQQIPTEQQRQKHRPTGINSSAAVHALATLFAGPRGQAFRDVPLTTATILGCEADVQPADRHRSVPESHDT